MAQTPEKKRRKKRVADDFGSEVEGGKYICNGCGDELANSSSLMKHWRNACPAGPQSKVNCRYCNKEIHTNSILLHIRRKHPGEPQYEWYTTVRERTEEDKTLDLMLKEIGDPGGEKHFRDGYTFVFDERRRIARYAFEEVDQRCLGVEVVRDSNWLIDSFLPTDARVSGDDLDGLRSSTWNFAHLVCASNHQFTPERKKSARVSSIGCIQHANVNCGAWKQLELSFKHLSIPYRAFVFSATILSDNPEMMRAKPPKPDSKKRSKAVDNKKAVAKADAFIKIAVVQNRVTGEWCYDAYSIPNAENSTQSPNHFRTTLEEVNKLTEFTFLDGIKAVVQRRNLYEEGNAAKHEWLAVHPQQQQLEPQGEVENLEDSALGNEYESEDDLEEVSADEEEEHILDTKDTRIAELEEKVEVLEEKVEILEAELAAAYQRIAELE